MRVTKVRTRAGTEGHGARVEGVDLKRLSPAEADQIATLINEHQVLVFPAQALTPDEQVAFSSHFGAVGEHPMGHRLSDTNPDEQLVMTVGTEARNDIWHADVTFMPNPWQYSCLHALTAVEGGDTSFANMFRAWDTLSDGMKEMLTNMRAIHTGKGLVGPVKPFVKAAEAGPKDKTPHTWHNEDHCTGAELTPKKVDV